jgi:kynurenine formamidase
MAAGFDISTIFESVKNWGRWGSEDQRGALNLITERQVAYAASLVRSGELVSCARDLLVDASEENPSPAHHTILRPGDGSPEGGHQEMEVALDYFGVACHGMSVSHLDALCHVFVDGQMYNGRSAEAVHTTGPLWNSVEATFNGIAGRGVLLDIPRLRGIEWLEPGDTVPCAELEAAAGSQGVEVGQGDILLVRTGRDARRLELGPWDPTVEGLAGLRPDCALWLRERDIAVLGSDGISDPLPGGDPQWPIPIHQCCLVAMGVHLLDNLELNRLAAACAAAGRWQFLFAVMPLRIPQGTGSPVNPVAIL